MRDFADHYSLLRCLGGGALFAVHEAIERRTGARVAIKCLRNEITNLSEAREMLGKEGMILSRVSHPNVVSLRSIEITSRGPVLVTEFVRATVLSRLMRSRPPPQVAAGIAVQILHGLGALHDATSASGSTLEVVHGDISPQNILLGVHGRVVIVDLAGAQCSCAMLSGGVVWGRATYLAPEQLLGRQVDRGADIYSTGAILWELLTGLPLFSNRDAVRRSPAPPSTRGANVSDLVDLLVLAALAPSSRRRYLSAMDSAAAIESCMGVASCGEIARWVGQILSLDSS